MLMGAVASGGGALPFWATANQYGLMPEGSGGLALVSARTSFDESKTFQWRWGACVAASLSGTDVSLLGYDAAPGAVYSYEKVAFRPMVDELYVSGRWKVLRADVGMFHREREFLGASAAMGSLSSTEGHIVESNNARTMPGYKLTLEPLSVPFTKDHLKIFGSWGDYRTLDDRYVDGALVHRTLAYLRYDISPAWFVQLGLDHYAMWGGLSPDFGDMGASFSNYLRVVTGQSASATGTLNDQLNVIGDQGGAEQLRAGWRGRGCSVTFQYEKPYSDKSGMRLANFPDGVYTLHFSFDNKDKWVSDVLAEFKYTMWQSGTIHDMSAKLDGNAEKYGGYYLGCDNYFTNCEYRCGWTHYGRSICDPQFYTSEFLSRAALGYYSDVPLRAVHNSRFKAIHIGVSGKLFRVAPYKLMLTQSWNYGSYGSPYLPPSSYASTWKWWQRNTIDRGLPQFCGAFLAALPLSAVSGSRLPLSFTAGLYLDRGKVLPSSFAASLGISIIL